MPPRKLAEGSDVGEISAGMVSCGERPCNPRDLSVGLGLLRLPELWRTRRQAERAFGGKPGRVLTTHGGQYRRRCSPTYKGPSCAGARTSDVQPTRIHSVLASPHR